MKTLYQSGKTNTELLCYALGWQGGTIHQVAEATRLTHAQILNLDATPERGTSNGWFAVRTCSHAYLQKRIFPDRQGNVAFWAGAARGIAISIVLQESCQGFAPSTSV